MTANIIKRVIGTQNLPGSILAISSLPRISYADQFTFIFPSSSSFLSTTPEQWARALFGSIPSFTEVLIWRYLLGLRLTRGRSPSTIAGWKIGGRGEDWIRLETSGWFLAGNMIVRRGKGEREGWVELVTFLCYRWWLGRIVWGVLGGIHRMVVPGVLRGAAARMIVGR